VGEVEDGKFALGDGIFPAFPSETGLILAGVSPEVAIRYQIVVMYMLLAATALAALATARLAEHALFDDAHRLAPLLLTLHEAR